MPDIWQNNMNYYFLILTQYLLQMWTLNKQYLEILLFLKQITFVDKNSLENGPQN